MRKTSNQKQASKQKKGSVSAPKAAKGKSGGIVVSSKLTLPKELQKKILGLMVKSRVLEERLIKVYKVGDSFFWIGGPGEEAFGVPLGLLVNKGQGPQHDYLHLHYRGTPTLLAMGMTMEDSLRLMMNRSTDPSTGGRNFCNHYCFPEWNVVPVSSPIEVQYGIAVGTAMSQRRKKSKGITIVTGGDAGTAEGDFATSLIWASRPGNELPMLLTVQNNRMGISTKYETQHGEKYIADRGKAFGIRTTVVNGNDPIETYLAIQTEMEYIRRTGKPVLAEFQVSRLYGHSSADGANRQSGLCCIENFEKSLVDQKIISNGDVKKMWAEYDEESRTAADLVRSEPVPQANTIWDHVYANNENADWRKF
ncbi:MAG TPA: thiamine pyrophosphate-dependent dehydrogenase E1 component subunit alpha [Bdellovibrionales bacterium]|nr:thiamine pyrophosphate-dependent dehydrogenase E1 component subunit alpha [Bdellovibrionales bacterium]